MGIVGGSSKDHFFVATRVWHNGPSISLENRKMYTLKVPLFFLSPTTIVFIWKIGTQRKIGGFSTKSILTLFFRESTGERRKKCFDYGTEGPENSIIRSITTLLFYSTALETN